MTAALDILALGIVIPVLPHLVKEFHGGHEVNAAGTLGLFGTVWALMQFVFSPILGALSDRFGRRPVLLFSCAGLGLDYLLMAWAPTLNWLLLGRVLSGVTAASFSTAGAYVADVTPPEKRAASYGIMGAAFSFGFVCGPALGGFLGEVSPRLPFWVAGGLSLMNFVYGLVVLPESLPRDRRAPFSWKRANPLGSLVLLRRHAELLGLSAVHFLFQLAHQAFPAVFVLYAGHRFGWKPRTVGALLALVGVCSIVVQAGLVRRFVARWGEPRAVLTGLFFAAAGFTLYGLAPNEPLFWFAVPLFAPAGLLGPSAQGLMTKRIGPTEQGRLQGALGSINGIAGLIGPGLYTSLFAAAIGPWKDWGLPGAPYLLAAVLLLFALPIAAAATRPVKG